MDTDSLVARLCPPRTEIARVRERISYWVKAELFIMGAMQVGRGRSRNFNPRCLLEAGLFNELANVGFPVTAYAMSGASIELIKAGEAWAAGDQQPRWLQISITAAPSKQRSGQITAIPHIGALAPIWLPNITTMIVIDVAALLRQVQWSREDEQKSMEHDNAWTHPPTRQAQLGTKVRRRSR